MKSFYFFLYIFSILSCTSIKEVSIQVLVPPVEVFDSNVKTIMLVKGKPDFSTSDYSLLKNYQPALDDKIYERLHHTFLNYLKENYKIIFFEIDEKVSHEKLKELCKQKEVEVAFTINSAFINVENIMTTVEDNLQYYGLCQLCGKYFPSPAKTNYGERSSLDQCPYCKNQTDILYLYTKELMPFNADYSSKAKMSISLSFYHASQNQVNQHKIIFDDYVFVKRKAIYNGITHYYNDYAEDLCRVASKSDKPFSYLISASKQAIMQKIYYTQNIDLLEAKMEVDIGHWDHAAEIWERLLLKSRGRKTKLAQKNMEVYRQWQKGVSEK